MSRIINEGRWNHRKPEEYLRRVKEIKEEINLKYSVLQRGEKNVFKRIIIGIKRIREINNEINKIGGFGNLYSKN